MYIYSMDRVRMNKPREMQHLCSCVSRRWFSYDYSLQKHTTHDDENSAASFVFFGLTRMNLFSSDGLLYEAQPAQRHAGKEEQGQEGSGGEWRGAAV